MLSEGLAVNTWLHRVAVGPKLLLLTISSIALVAASDWRVHAAALVGAVVISVCVHRADVASLGVLRRLVPLLTIITGIQAVFDGWSAALVISMRMLTMLLLADLVSATTRMGEMIEALTPFLKILKPIGVTPRKAALAMALVLRFVPLILLRWRAIEEAWAARSHRRVPPRLLALLIVDTICLADRVAEALDARGFGTIAGQTESSVT